MITIRSARPDDTPLMLDMLRQSAAHQGFPDALVVSEADLLEDGFGLDPRFHCALAEVDGTPAGLALYFFNYSTWVSRTGLYLEDLYIDRRFRRQGVARALLDHLAETAREAGCGKMQWLVHRANDSALGLYRSWGAQELEDWVLMTASVPSAADPGE